MLRIRHIALSLPLVVFTSALSLGADSPAITLLKGKDLTRSGHFFVITAEKPIMEKWEGARPVLADYLATAERKNETELAARQLAQLEERRVDLQERLNWLNQQINEQGFQQSNNRANGFGQRGYLSQLIAQRDMIRMNLAEIGMTQTAAKSEAGTDQKTLEAESKQRLEAAKAVLKELRESVDAAMKQYDTLDSDSSVKSALQTLEKDKLGSFKLGPSTKFKSTVKALENAERRILAKNVSTASRKKGKSRR